MTWPFKSNPKSNPELEPTLLETFVSRIEEAVKHPLKWSEWVSTAVHPETQSASRVQGYCIRQGNDSLVIKPDGGVLLLVGNNTATAVESIPKRISAAYIALVQEKALRHVDKALDAEPGLNAPK